MTKADSLITRLGTGLADSIGVRRGESTLLRPRDATAAIPPQANFKLNRSAGTVDVDEVIPDPNQPRKEFDEAELQRLSDDIKARGQLQPIRTRWSPEHGKWIIIAGERRFRAIKRAGLAEISCIFVDGDLSESAIRSEQLVENLLREDLKPVEEANAFKSLMELNKWTGKELAEQLNISPTKVSQALSLLKLPDDLQRKVDAGELAATAAYQLSRVKDPEKLRELAIQAEAGGVAEARKAVTANRAGQSRRSTNETFKTTNGLKVTVSSRKYLGDDGILEAMLELADQVRRRMKRAA